MQFAKLCDKLLYILQLRRKITFIGVVFLISLHKPRSSSILDFKWIFNISGAFISDVMKSIEPANNKEEHLINYTGAIKSINKK
jgi:hypothetical protein